MPNALAHVPNAFIHIHNALTRVTTISTYQAPVVILKVKVKANGQCAAAASTIRCAYNVTQKNCRLDIANIIIEQILLQIYTQFTSMISLQVIA